MLSLVGLGLQTADLTQRGLQAMQQADVIYAEFYTNTAHNIDTLEAQTGQSITVLDRTAVEQQDVVAQAAQDKHIAFLVSGDPLTATTHYELVYRLRQNNIPVEIIHNASIVTAIAETGLSLYKFGRTTTLPAPEDGYVPPSVYEAIASNQQAELHTLVLLDIDLTASRAMDTFLSLEQTQRQGILSEDTPVVAAARLGTPDATIIYTTLGNQEKLAMGEPPQCLIIPATLNHTEEEFLHAHRH